MANEAMDTIRKSIEGGLNVKQRWTLKGNRKLLLMRKRNLEPMQQLIMDTWLKSFLELRNAHGLKEGFYSVWDAKDERDMPRTASRHGRRELKRTRPACGTRRSLP